MPADPRLIIALDTPMAPPALEMARQIGDAACFYKIGLGMLAGGGMAAAMELKDQGHQVFLDMKLFDIPATIETAVSGLTQFELDFLTVHGDPHVVAAASQQKRNTKILAVTILTSHDRADLDASLIRDGDLADITVERAARALDAGADGVITSPREAARIAALPEAKDRLIVTPGIRPLDTASNDQKRIATPSQAIAEGATHIVVGRPVTQSSNPRTAALAIAADMARALTVNSRP